MAVLVGVAAWATLALALRRIDQSGAVTLVPLLVLAATFEISFFIHTGVERIGRYLQVFYEERAGSIGWETTAMNLRRGRFPARGLDPLFSVVFFAAGALNFFDALATASSAPAGHASRSWRTSHSTTESCQARRISATQRATDLDAFRDLRMTAAR